MADDLDTFQADYLVPLTPEEDRDFAPKPGCCGWVLAILGLLGAVLVYLLM